MLCDDEELKKDKQRILDRVTSAEFKSMPINQVNDFINREIIHFREKEKMAF